MSDEEERMNRADREWALVPRLRFPEFEHKPAWAYQRLERLSKRVTDKNTDERVTRVLTNSAERGVISQREYFDKDIATKGNLDNYYIVENGDFIYNPRISASAPVGPLSRSNTDRGVMSPLYIVFRFDQIGTDFYEQYFKSAAWHSYLRSVSNTGARHDRMSVTNVDFMRMPIPIPHKSEQQKIADCLGSLDDLIAAEQRKLAALRKHKQGLMQQLFPREGETRPRLRFPKFRNASDWGRVPLTELLARDPQYGVNTAAVPYAEDLPTYIRITDIDDEGRYVPNGKVSVDIDVTDDSYLREGDIVLARTGASVGKSYRYIAEDGPLVYAGFLIRVRPKPGKLVSHFLAAYLTTSEYWNWVRTTSARSGQPGINVSEYASLAVPIPLDDESVKEQKKIGDFFSGLDAQVGMQKKKLREMRAHKRGLLQQILPRDENIV